VCVSVVSTPRISGSTKGGINYQARFKDKLFLKSVIISGWWVRGEEGWARQYNNARVRINCYFFLSFFHSRILSRLLPSSRSVITDKKLSTITVRVLILHDDDCARNKREIVKLW